MYSLMFRERLLAVFVCELYCTPDIPLRWSRCKVQIQCGIKAMPSAAREFISVSGNMGN